MPEETTEQKPESSTGQTQTPVAAESVTLSQLGADEELPTFETMNDAQRIKYLETGELTRTKQPPADNGKKAEAAATSDQSEQQDEPESEAGETQQELKASREKKSSNAETRAAELETEIAELKRQKREKINTLLAERRQLRQELAQPANLPESQTGAKPAAAQSADDPEPQAPDIDQFDGDWSAYQKANHEYVRKMGEWTARQTLKENLRVQETARQQSEQSRRNAEIQAKNEEIRENWTLSMAESKKRHQDFDAVVKSFTIPDYAEFDEYIRESPNALELVYQLASNPSEAERIIELRPAAMKREMRRFEMATIEKIKTPPPKKITTAKPPGTELGGRNAAPVDELAAAIEAGDFERFKQLEDARESKRFVK